MLFFLLLVLAMKIVLFFETINLVEIDIELTFKMRNFLNNVFSL